MQMRIARKETTDGMKYQLNLRSELFSEDGDTAAESNLRKVLERVSTGKKHEEYLKDVLDKFPTCGSAVDLEPTGLCKLW